MKPARWEWRACWGSRHVVAQYLHALDRLGWETRIFEVAPLGFDAWYGVAEMRQAAPVADAG